jgi:hypothetical protein
MQEIDHFFQEFAALLPCGKIQVNGKRRIAGRPNSVETSYTAQVFPDFFERKGN